ncbi:nucleotidyltransferase family protein [Desulfococcaceae bacterium HSG9]|nr:nucleotidyltransferase family protein [Desulfococcaceae bacterium HSG9]
MNIALSYQPTAGVILAAGRSTRFGTPKQPKQLLKLNNTPMVELVLDNALKSRLQRIVLVLGCQYQSILKHLGKKAHHPRLQIVVNHSFKEGLSSSLHCGLNAVQRKSEAVMFLLADQPLADAGLINLLLENFEASDKGICVPVYKEKRGNPTIFSRHYYDRLMMIKGDRGGRRLIKAHTKDVLEVQVCAPACFEDIDTLSDVAKIQRLI